MKTSLSVLIVVVWCSSASGAPSVGIQDFGFETNRFWIDVAVTDFAELAGQNLGGIAMGCTLSGLGTGHLGVDAPAMRLTGGQWSAEVAPRTYAWASFTSMSTAANTGGVGDLTTFGMLNDPLQAVPVSGDAVVCRFLYAWDNILPEEGSIVIHLSGDVGEPLPYLIDQNFDEVDAGVSNNNLAVPEPATMTLVVLGLSGIFIRERRRHTA